MEKRKKDRYVVSKRAIAFLGILCLGIMLTFVSCDSGANMIVSETVESNQETGNLLTPNVKLQISYDQKTMTFKRFWPQDIVAGKAKNQTGASFL